MLLNILGKANSKYTDCAHCRVNLMGLYYIIVNHCDDNNVWDVDPTKSKRKYYRVPLIDSTNSLFSASK